MTALGAAHGYVVGARAWSLAALALVAVAAVATVAVVLASGQDVASLRWPLVAAPLIGAALPVVLPRRATRISAAVVLFAWCVLAAASVGMLFLPAAFVALAAARKQGRP